MFGKRMEMVVEKNPLDVLISSTRLTNREYDVLLKRYKQDFSLEQIASQMRIPIQQVERLEKRALAALEDSRRGQEVKEEVVKPLNPDFKIPVFTQRSAHEIKRERLVQENLEGLKSGDNVFQWFHVQMVANGIRHLIGICAEALSDNQIVALASIYGEGSTVDQVRQLLQLKNKQEAKTLVRSGIEKIWDDYPELAMKTMQAANN